MISNGREIAFHRMEMNQAYAAMTKKLTEMKSCRAEIDLVGPEIDFDRAEIDRDKTEIDFVLTEIDFCNAEMNHDRTEN